MAYLDVSTVVFAVLFQRFVYQKSSYSLSGRASAPSKNGFFSGVFNLSYGLIVLGLYLHMGNPFFQGEGLWEWALRYFLGVICFFGGGLLLKEGRTSLGPDYSDCKDSYLPRKIRTKGIYSYIRHPIYSGNLLMTLGNVFVLPGYPSFILLGVLTASYHLAIRREEKDLRNHFEVYESYVKSTGAFMPVLTIKKYVEVDASFVRAKNESQIEPVESNTKLAA
jgi:hypothetical protein